jgi:lipopolysaccharide export system protein LptA
MPSKIHASMKHSSASLWPILGLALGLALATGAAQAEKADSAKPMNVEADALRYDDLRQVSVFTGRVIVTKGTIVLRGARIEVRQEPGKRAFFRQKREGVDEFIEGEALTIEYDGRADKVKFIGQAEMRRLRGTTLNDEMTGSLITYDNTSEVFTVDGGPAGATPASPGGRVRATLAPKPGASAPAAAPTAPAPLRPSTTLGGETR